jgi:hypothetical protein
VVGMTNDSMSDSIQRLAESDQCTQNDVELKIRASFYDKAFANALAQTPVGMWRTLATYLGVAETVPFSTDSQRSKAIEKLVNKDDAKELIKAFKDKYLPQWNKVFAAATEKFKGDLRAFELFALFAMTDAKLKSLEHPWMQGSFLNFNIQAKGCEFSWSAKKDIEFSSVTDVQKSWK